MGTSLDSANSQNEIFSEHFNGTAWSVVPMPPVNSSNINAFSQFNGIKANSPSDVRAVGDSGVTDVPSSQKALIEHFNGTAWSIVPSPSPGSIDVLSGVTTSNASNNVWAVGADTPAGTSVRQTLTLNWNGTSWNVVASPNTVSTDGLGAVATNPAPRSCGPSARVVRPARSAPSSCGTVRPRLPRRLAVCQGEIYGIGDGDVTSLGGRLGAMPAVDCVR